MKYIFEIKIKQGYSINDYVEAWKKGSEIMQKMPGAEGTRLFTKIGEENTLLAIAEWESKDARDRAKEELEKVDEKTKEILHAHNEFGEFKKIGAYNETGWEVVPE